MYPDLPKLELFARSQRPDWDAWGNEIEPAEPAAPAAEPPREAEPQPREAAP
jgi:hypothetical protein